MSIPSKNLIVLALALVGLAGAAGCGTHEPARAPAAPPPSVTAPVAQAAEIELPDAADTTGTVEPLRRAQPGTKIMGRVERVHVREGDRVRAGQALATLDSRDLAAAVGQARAAVKMAEAQLENAAAMHRRMTALEAKGSATAKNLEDATAGFRTATAGLEQAQANQRAAEVMAGYAEIRSPIAGVVTAKRIESGDMAGPGQPLFTVEDTSRVKITVRVPESRVVGLAKGAPATVRIDVLDQDRDATIERVLPVGDPLSRTFEVQLLLDNPDGRIQSGMFARARFGGGVTRRTIAVPRTAIVARGELQGVFVVAGDGVARLRWLRLGRAAGDHVEVLSGLAAGESFVTLPPATLADGTPVTHATQAARAGEAR